MFLRAKEAFRCHRTDGTCIDIIVWNTRGSCSSGGKEVNGSNGAGMLTGLGAKGTGEEKKHEEQPRRKKSRFAPPPTGAQNLAAGAPSREHRRV